MQHSCVSTFGLVLKATALDMDRQQPGFDVGDIGIDALLFQAGRKLWCSTVGSCLVFEFKMADGKVIEMLQSRTPSNRCVITAMRTSIEIGTSRSTWRVLYSAGKTGTWQR